ncbi:MAG: tRNA 2-thiouridine(34) synthase MnmA [Spiribacter salinus]|uniref:tRNA-specific 2-thiouridylase MnmA n=1 Tax=Spiribacter salinus TaxID=1335746 RepID=A0A540VWF0_9GAMM|nr:MAG: tRNA 2-thiouridine(34) synthase MnmA [Spiribacter salinus]
MNSAFRVIVGLSGGVDSAVSAWLLREQGYRVEGLFMKNWEDDDSTGHCNAEADFADARQVADTLDIPLHRANFASAYREEVFEHCLGEFRAGRTPNPDILCNQRIKFRAFLEYAERLGADYVATGHYAGIGGPPGAHQLLRASDRNKDQTYFLYTLGQEPLSRAIFPLANLAKPEVRRLADSAGFGNYDKPDSTGICFIGERDFRAFLARYISTSPGPIVSVDGGVLGEHVGLAFYTLGQRRGLHLGGHADRPGLPWYVAEKDLENNRLLVAQGHDHPALMNIGLFASDWHWVDGQGPMGEKRCTARLRHRQPDQPATLRPVNAGRWRVDFDTPQRAVAPGQSVVLYDGEVCLGGGIIDTRIPVPEASAVGAA